MDIFPCSRAAAITMGFTCLLYTSPFQVLLHWKNIQPLAQYFCQIHEGFHPHNSAHIQDVYKRQACCRTSSALRSASGIVVRRSTISSNLSFGITINVSTAFFRSVSYTHLIFFHIGHLILSPGCSCRTDQMVLQAAR